VAGDPRARALPPDLRLGDVRRRRLHARHAPSTSPAASPGDLAAPDGAPDLRRPHQGRARRDPHGVRRCGRLQRARPARRPEGGSARRVDADRRRLRPRRRAGRSWLPRAAGSASVSLPSRRATRRPPRSTHDAEVLVAKARAGAEFAVTQMFFDARDYFALVERVRARRRHPDPPGHHADPEPQCDRQAGRAVGTDVPDHVVATFDGLTEPAEIRAEGIGWPPSSAASCSRAARRACTSTR
jgi:hypothetical protein